MNTPSTAAASRPVENQVGAHPRSGRRIWCFRLAAMFLVPLVGLGVLEVILRLVGYGHSTAYFIPRREIDGRDVFVENRSFGLHFFPKGLARQPEACVLPAFKSPRAYRIFILGESAALGYPDPSVNFGRILDVMLKLSYPDRRFEVINTAMTAINSHVILPIAREAAGHEPDLLVVYMGNNEVVGPYGTAEVLGAFAPSLTLIRASVKAKTLRTAQFLASALPTRTPETPRWEGMVMFAKSRVRADDPRMETVYGNFERNLRDICQAGLDAGAKVIVSTMAVNLKDSAPFASLPDPALSPEQAEAWQKCYDEAVRLAATGDQAGAIKNLRQAEGIDGKVADLHFRLARCLTNQGKLADAHRHFVLARDLDALRFRADARINEAIRAVAASREDDGIYLADTEKRFGAASMDGTPGENLFYEHVHMNFEGNYLLACSVFDQIARIESSGQGPGGRGQGKATREAGTVLPDPWPMPPDPSLKERLAYGDWKHFRALGVIARIMQDPPFSGQLDAGERYERAVRKLQELEKRLAEGGLQQAVTEFRRAIALDGDDPVLRSGFADLLSRLGDHQEAIPQLQAALRLQPHDAAPYLRLANALNHLKRHDEALALCAEAARSESLTAGEIDSVKGAIYMDMRKLPEAVASFRQAVKSDPLADRYHVLLGMALTAQGKIDEAIAAYQEAARVGPKSIDPHVKLAELYSNQGQALKAIEQFQAALRIDPAKIDVHIGLASAYFTVERYEESIRHNREALRINPKSPVAYFGLAMALSRQGKIDEAIGHMEHAVRLQPNWGDAAGELGELRRRKMAGNK